MIIFVVPLAHDHSPYNNDELRFMLRSLEKNFVDEYHVIVIGDKKPEWYSGTFIHINRPTASVNYENFYDTLNKLKYIANNTHYPRFVYIYDDVCLLKKTDRSFFNVTYYIGEPTGNDKWKNTIRKSLELVPGKNYESHIPVIFNRIKLKLIFGTYPYSYSGIPYAPISLYFNTFKQEIQPLKDQLCYNKIEDNAIWLNYNDKYFIDLHLQDIFTKKSRYEIY